jgi:hypothetical protein
LRQCLLEEVGAGVVEQVTELELGGTEGAGTGVGNQEVSDVLEEFFGARTQDFEETLNVGLLLLGQRRQGHERLLPFSGHSCAHLPLPSLVYKESTNWRDAHTGPVDAIKNR